MLSKLFKRKSVPTKEGTSEPSRFEKQQYIKVFELVLSNMEDSPVYALKNQLTVGSEIGNIIISDPSVSPRHATFILQQDVVSVMDHGSVAGTSVNGNKIPAGKYVILEENDVVNVGDLEIKLKVGTASVPIEEIPYEEPAEEAKEEAQSKEESKPKPSISSLTASPKEKGFNKEEILKKAKKNKTQVSLAGRTYSANAVVRVLAVICDLLLSYSIIIVFLPFDEFRHFLEFIPEMLLSLIPPEANEITNDLLKDYGFVTEMLKDLYSFFSSTFHFGPLLIVFILNRLVTTLFFGASISEVMLGMRKSGNGIWARVGGVLRVIIGVFTGPFLIFDLPAVVSRRTFKEIITFTNLQVPSKFISILGILFYLPLVLAFLVVAPLVEGLEPPEPVIISDRIEQRVRVKKTESEATTEVAAPVSDFSDALNMELTYSPDEVHVFTGFKFLGASNKVNLKTSLIFYQRDLQREVEWEVFKTFDFKELLGVGMKGNVFLYDKYPEIYNYVYQSDDTNPAFKKTKNDKAETVFANQFIEFTKNAFSLSLENTLDIMQEQTPVLKSFIDYKASFFSLIEYKDYSEIGFQKIGNAIFMRISYQKQKPFDLLIPLIRGQGKIYKVSFGTKENSGSVISKFYKFNLVKTNWFPGAAPERGETFSALQVYDLFSKDSFKKQLMTAAGSQSFYGYYYETSAAILKTNDSVELDIWKNNVRNTIKLIETLPAPVLQEGEEDFRAKLIQNFRDLSDALENNNTDYFGISTSTSV